MMFKSTTLVALLAFTTTSYDQAAEALNLKRVFRFGRKTMPKEETAVPAPAETKPEYDLDITELFSGNKDFIDEKLKLDAEYFNKLGTIHSPKYLYIGMFRH